MLLEPSDKAETFGKASYWGIRITTESGDTLAKGAPRGYNEWFPVSVTAPAGDNQLSAVILEGVFTPEIPTLPTRLDRQRLLRRHHDPFLSVTVRDRWTRGSRPRCLWPVRARHSLRLLTKAPVW